MLCWQRPHDSISPWTEFATPQVSDNQLGIFPVHAILTGFPLCCDHVHDDVLSPMLSQDRISTGPCLINPNGKDELAVVYNFKSGERHQDNPFTGDQALTKGEMEKLQETKKGFEIDYVREWRGLP